MNCMLNISGLHTPFLSVTVSYHYAAANNEIVNAT